MTETTFTAVIDAERAKLAAVDTRPVLARLVSGFRRWMDPKPDDESVERFRAATDETDDDALESDLALCIQCQTYPAQYRRACFACLRKEYVA